MVGEDSEETVSNFLKCSALQRSQQRVGGDGAQRKQPLGVLGLQRVWSWGAVNRIMIANDTIDRHAKRCYRK